MNKPGIRSYSSEDREEVLLILREGLSIQEKYASIISPPENVGFFAEEWEEHTKGLNQFPEEWWVYQNEERITGILWTRFQMDKIGPYGSIREIIVAGDYRNLGIGTRLVKHAVGLAIDRGADFFLISSLVSNPAVRLYRRLGFSDFPDRFKEDKNPNHVVLWKPLTYPLNALTG